MHFGYLYVFFGKMSNRSSAHYFFIGILVCFVLYWTVWAVYILETNPLQVISCCKSFSQFLDFFFLFYLRFPLLCKSFLIRSHYFVVVQSVNSVWLFATPWTAAHHAFLPFTISCSLLRLIFIEPMMPSNHFLLCHPLLRTSIFSSLRVFSNELALCIRWSKYWSLRFSISPSSD